MRKTLIALALAAIGSLRPQQSEWKIKPASIAAFRQHPSLKHGKSGVAAAKRAARKKKGCLKK